MLDQMDHRLFQLLVVGYHDLRFVVESSFLFHPQHVDSRDESHTGDYD